MRLRLRLRLLNHPAIGRDAKTWIVGHLPSSSVSMPLSFFRTGRDRDKGQCSQPPERLTTSYRFLFLGSSPIGFEFEAMHLLS
jgi:hypothetical protein